jgi:hypothetical protein
MGNDNVKKLVNTRNDVKQTDSYTYERIELSEGRTSVWNTSGEEKFFQMQMQSQQNQSQQASSNVSDSKKE